MGVGRPYCEVEAHVTRLATAPDDTRMCWTRRIPLSRHKSPDPWKRKRRIFSVGEYLALATDPTKKPYKCEVCGAVHQGHPIEAATDVSSEVAVARPPVNSGSLPSITVTANAELPFRSPEETKTI